jgi:2-heptyl-3-hydroxy-4(1H)-quinolone synthase
MMGARRVLIVGGGIAGLALARLLARTRVAPEVIEREPVWRPVGTGMYLPGNAARALDALGLQAQVASPAVENSLQRFYDDRGRLLCQSTSPRSGRPSLHAWRSTGRRIVHANYRPLLNPP